MPKIKQCYVQGDMGSNNVYMTSGFQAPTNIDLVQRSNISAYFQSFASGGSIEHVFLGGKISNNMKKNLIDKMFRSPLTYMTMSPVVSICTKCSTKHIGEYYKCNNCGDDEHMMVYARVIGYVRPIVSGKIKVENKMINGTNNYWQDTRRYDWVERHVL